MSNDNEYSEHYEEPQPPGMSTGTKMVLIALGVFGVLCVACCGGGIWWIRSNFDMQTSSDPLVVRKSQGDILDLQVPARFEPRQSMKMKFVVANMEMAMFEAGAAESSQLVFMKMTFIEEMNQQQAEAQFNQQIPNHKQLDESKSETRKYTVDGKEISVTFSHGILKQGDNAPAGQAGKEWYAVSSMMPVKGGMVMFHQMGPEEEFNEEEIETMINSIRFPAED